MYPTHTGILLEIVYSAVHETMVPNKFRTMERRKRVGNDIFMEELVNYLEENSLYT